MDPLKKAMQKNTKKRNLRVKSVSAARGVNFCQKALYYSPPLGKILNFT